MKDFSFKEKTWHFCQKNSEYCGQSIDVVLCIVCSYGYTSSKYMFYYYNPPLNGWNNAESKTLFNQSYYNLDL